MSSSISASSASNLDPEPDPREVTRVIYIRNDLAIPRCFRDTQAQCINTTGNGRYLLMKRPTAMVSGHRTALRKALNRGISSESLISSKLALLLQSLTRSLYITNIRVLKTVLHFNDCEHAVTHFILLTWNPTVSFFLPEILPGPRQEIPWKQLMKMNLHRPRRRLG